MKVQIKLLFLSFVVGITNVDALTISPDGPDQMPVLFVHGVNSDGALWGVGPLDGELDGRKDLASRYLETKTRGPARSPSRFFDLQGVPNWAVQWQAIGNDSSYARASEGRAFLQTPEELRAGVDWVAGTWMSQNNPLPNARSFLSFKIEPPFLAIEPEALLLNVDTSKLPVPVSDVFKLLFPLTAVEIVKSQLKAKRNYQTAGHIDDRAENLLSMLSDERRLSGKLENYRQVNILTHSMGSLVTRAALHKAYNKSLKDSEFVANVIYNAPPFAGSTMAYLANLLFEPTQITRDIFNDPLIRRLVETHPETVKSIGEIVDIIAEPLYERLGYSRSSLYAILPHDYTIDKALIDTITLGPVGVNLLDELAVNEFWGGLAVAFMNDVLRDLLSEMNALPGMKELEPEGGATHISRYSTAPADNQSVDIPFDVKQFVTLGNGGPQINLFPQDLEAVVVTPNLLFDAPSLFTGPDDLAVAEGSAKLLTTTDKFGPAMTLLSPINLATGVFEGLEHEDLWSDNVPTMAPVWMKTLWVPPTSLVINENVVEIDSVNRSYIVSDIDTQINFDSKSFDKTLTFGSEFPPFQQRGVTITISAVSHQYRVIADDGSSDPSDWVDVIGSSASFRQIVENHSLINTPFFFEWRSINEAGGREMIRRARFSILGDVPQIASYQMLSTRQNEVIKQAAFTQLDARAYRSKNLVSALNINPLMLERLNTVTEQPEAHWVLRNPQDKALMLTLDSRADIDYSWDENTLINATRMSSVTSASINLGNLTDGQHNLYVRMSITNSGLTKQSKVFRFGIAVDNTPPVINFAQGSHHPLGMVVGPTTPLYFTVQDIDSNSATGTALIAGQEQWSYPDSKIFSLNNSGLLEDLALKGIAGGFIDIVFDAIDAVGNSSQTTQQFYLDIVPPEHQVVDVLGALPNGENKYVTSTNTVQLIINRTDAGAGVDQNPELFVIRQNGDIGDRNELLLGIISGHVDDFGIELKLAEGVNKVVISSEDIAGNISSLELEINYTSIESVSEVDNLSPRLETCFDQDGAIAVCGATGAIQELSSSYHGDTVVFSSGGRRFVNGDVNNEQDIFVYRDGKLNLASTSHNGEQANDFSNFPQISGNGRYVVFQSTSTNLAPNTERTGSLPQKNLFIKDLDNGRIAVISRQPDQSPANLTGSFNYYPAVTFSGRYVFFSARVNRFVDSITSPDSFEKIYMVDLDPDGNGDYFDNDYQNHAVSFKNSSEMLAGKIWQPSVSQDGKYLVFSSGVNAITPSSGVMLFKFLGSEADGSLNVSTRESVFIGDGRLGRVSPVGDSVAFISRNNLTTDDTNLTGVDTDVYLSSGETVGGAFSSRQLTLLSKGFDGSASTGNGGYVLKDLSISEDRLSSAADVKVSWVSQHTNIVPDDINNREDLFVYRQSAVFPTGLLVPNWVNSNTPGAGSFWSGKLTPDGRYALWTTLQTYFDPFAADGDSNIYRRRIDPAEKTTLSIGITGDGTVSRNPEGVFQTIGSYAYNDDEKVLLTAQAADNSIFTGWSRVGSSSKELTVDLKMHDSVNITANFEAVAAPISANAQIFTQSNIESEGIAPIIQGEAGQLYSINIEAAPANGQASVSNGLLFYKSNPGFVGNDSFTFQVTNQFNQRLVNPATAVITVNAINEAPISAQLIIKTEQDVASAIELPTIVDSTVNESFSYQLLVSAQHGIVDVSASGFVYMPETGFIGKDSFLYLIRDSANNSISATAIVTVSEKIESGGVTPPVQTAGGSSGGGGLLDAELLILLLFVLVLHFSFYISPQRRLNL